MNPPTSMNDVVHVEEHETYRFVDIKGGHMTEALRFLETRCVGRRVQWFRLGQVPRLFCYHKDRR